MNQQSSAFGYIPIVIAANKFKADVLRAMLRRDDLDVNAADKDGYTGLITAVITGRRNSGVRIYSLNLR